MKSVAFAALLLVAFPAFAQAPRVTATDAWARATASSQKVGGAFLTLTDSGAPDRLLSASTPAAEMVELHQTVSDGGVMKMVPVAALDLVPGQPVELKPGGYHLMLMGLKQRLDVGATFPLTLTFAKAPPVTVTVTVARAGASSGAMDQGMVTHDGIAMPGMKP
jgi:copper(I)-binding protein